MEKIKLTLLIIALTFLIPATVSAENIAGSSAAIMTSNNKIKATVIAERDLMVKKKTIKSLIDRYNSPMGDSIDGFLATCERYNLDCYLLPSIATLESTLGRFVWPDSYNAFGWGGGYIMFDNWNEGIDAVGKGLRNNYINKGALSIEQIGKIYSESPTWAQRVVWIKRQFEIEEEKNQLYLDSVGVQL